jgi:nitrous oxidase accessory protein NosD
VQGGSVLRPGGNGVYATGSARLTLDGCEISATAYTAVHLGGTCEGTLTDCRITGSAEHGIRVTGNALLRGTATTVRAARMSGVSVEERGDVVLDRCAIQDTTTGVELRSAHMPVLADCDISGTERTGVEVGAGCSSLLRGTRIRRSGTSGLFADEDSAPVLLGCHISDTGGTGIVLWPRSHARILGSTVSGTAKNGVYVQAGAQALLQDCELSRTGYPAVYVGAGAVPVLRRCRFSDLAEDVVLAEGARPVFEGCQVERVVTNQPSPSAVRLGPVTSSRLARTLTCSPCRR